VQEVLEMRRRHWGRGGSDGDVQEVSGVCWRPLEVLKSARGLKEALGMR
jgi:hypothetical protein